jgi:uncharacterized membrane protein YfcA
MYFVSIWFAFAVALYWTNYFHGAQKYNGIPHWRKGVLYSYTLIPSTGLSFCPKLALEFNWRAFTLLGFGFLGGIFSSMSGSGLDICSFAALVLLFRVDERVATPTSVVLMAINTVIASFYRVYKMQEVSDEAFYMLLCCMPSVVVGAPFGALLSSHFHRAVLSIAIYITDWTQVCCVFM